MVVYIIYISLYFLRLPKRSQFIPLQNVVYFITFAFVVRKIFTFCINDVLLFKCPRVNLACSWFINGTLTLVWYHGAYVTPVVFDSRFFSETVTNTDIAFYVFYRKAFLTMSHTFASFCVSPFIFHLCLFPLGDKWTP